uniref:Uncharacterized protein n=1 Tax=Glossina palpalis gambiensis TaxID=67801 RepID=A0A1B0BV90_9MUSC
MNSRIAFDSPVRQNDAKVGESSDQLLSNLIKNQLVTSIMSGIGFAETTIHMGSSYYHNNPKEKDSDSKANLWTFLPHY